MLISKVVKATEENWEDAYQIFYCSLRKLISEEKEEKEEKGNWFGGMSEDDVKESMKGSNALYLVYRKHDEMPVAAISILKQDNYQNYDSILKEGNFNKSNIRTLNAMAVRPELWGQGYGRKSLKAICDVLKKEGVDVLVGTVHPMYKSARKTLEYASKDGQVHFSLAFTMKTEIHGRLLNRRRFAFAIPE